MRRDVFQAIADPVRRRIIDLLKEHPQNVSSITESFEISQQAISKHIKVLVECGIIRGHKVGRENYYYLNPKELIPAYLWMESLQNVWEDRIDSFEAYIKQLTKEE